MYSLDPSIIFQAQYGQMLVEINEEKVITLKQMQNNYITNSNDIVRTKF